MEREFRDNEGFMNKEVEEEEEEVYFMEEGMKIKMKG